MTYTERAAYIRGLAEGLELDDNTKEVKVLKAMMELVEDMALGLSDVEEGYQDMADQLDEVDEDLGTLEEEVYGCDDDDCDCGCCDDDDDFEDDCYYEVTCPSCQETVCLSEDLIANGTMKCPNCGELLEFDMDDIQEDDDSCQCGCCCSDDE